MATFPPTYCYKKRNTLWQFGTCEKNLLSSVLRSSREMFNFLASLRAPASASFDCCTCYRSVPLAHCPR